MLIFLFLKPSDRGLVNGKPVLNVVRKGAEAIHFVQSDEPFAVGQTAEQRVDWAVRLDHMQQHSGEYNLIDCTFKIMLLTHFIVPRSTPHYRNFRTRVQTEYHHLVPGRRVLVHRTRHQSDHWPTTDGGRAAHQPNHCRWMRRVGGQRRCGRAKCVGGRHTGHARSSRWPGGAHSHHHLRWHREQHVLRHARPQFVPVTSGQVSQHGEEQGTHLVAFPGGRPSAAQADWLLRARVEV